MNKAVCTGIGALMLLVYFQFGETGNNTLVGQSLSQESSAFTKNMGQWDEQVLFRADVAGATMWFCRDRVVYQFVRLVDADAARVNQNRSRLPIDPTRTTPAEARLVEQLIVTAKFVNANPDAAIAFELPAGRKCNYFLGQDPSRWRADVPSYGSATIGNLYPDVDLKCTRDGSGQVLYEFVATADSGRGTPHRVPALSQVKIEYSGADEMCKDMDGRRLLRTQWGAQIPVLETPAGDGFSCSGLMSPIADAAFQALVVRAMPPARGEDLVGLVYSTRLGGSDLDETREIAVDDSGCAYVVGITFSTDFPVLNPYQNTYQGGGSHYEGDVFVTKLSPEGNSIVYSTYLGGSNGELAQDIAVDANGIAYITGVTFSQDFPMQNPVQAAYGSPASEGDAFVTALSSLGNELIYSTYLGGTGPEWGFAVTVDSAGCAYVVGFTSSANFPTANPLMTFQGGDCDAFLTKFSSTGAPLVYSTCLGGPHTEYGYGVAVDRFGAVYVTGFADYEGFPTVNAFQPTYQGGYGDAFVSKFSSPGDSLIFSTYLGGATNRDEGDCIAVDDSGHVYVAGRSSSFDFPQLNACQDHPGDYNAENAFVTKLSSSGTDLIFSTYLGGYHFDRAWGLALDDSGYAYVTGMTQSFNFPIVNALQPELRGESDAFVAEFRPTGGTPVYSTFLGGSDDDLAWGIDVEDHAAYIAGVTISPDFPERHPLQTPLGSVSVFVSKLAVVQQSCGDADGSGSVTVSDAVYLISYIFAGGPSPFSLFAGDADCSGTITISDAVYLITYIFAGGPTPCAACP